MKNYLIYLTITLLFCTSCEDVLLEKRDLSGLNEQVYEDSVLARTFVDNIYNENLPGWPSDYNSVSDEIAGESRFFEGTVDTRTVTTFGTSIQSNNAYGKIRAINKFLQDIETGGLSRNWTNLLKGQVYFFRAWRYFELVSLYGGVPLILEPQNPVGGADEELFVSRNSTSECIDQIVADLDSAIMLLPGRWDNENENWGRVTSGAAAAFKGRVLLYWASPQFNPGDLADRWQRAYEANREAVDLLTANGFGLHPDFQGMWFEEVGNPEAVFVTGYNNTANDQQKKNMGYDNSTRPSYLGTGGGSNQPTRQIVDAFPMADGKAIDDPTSAYAYDPNFFFRNRDPRFYASIAYNSTNWHILGDDNFHLWTYYVDSTSVEPEATTTGFYARKAIHPDIPAGEVQYAGTDWMEIRFAEVLLNLAESACGIGQLQEAAEGIFAVRERAGVEPGADNRYGLAAGLSREAMFDALIRERQIEFAFEGKRFWDLRRNRLFEELLNGTVRTGIRDIYDSSTEVAHDEFEEVRNELDMSETYDTYFNREEIVLDTRYIINWQAEYYFFPIPQQAIDNNPNLEQNQAWGGSFDPLQ